jgi:hypothetical protein
VHAWFLLFYAPFLCLLTLGYLFYVRDSLARAMFADLLDPPPPPRDFYYRRPLRERLKLTFRRIKGTVLGILPVLLAISSVYCASRYLALLDQSVVLASHAYVERLAASEEVVKEKSSVDSLPRPSDFVAVRQYVLRFSAIDDIPRVVELTVLYIGAFVALLVAVTLMALKEHAREALGLSEHELMFGRYHRTDEDE